jgi:hypothetical protein
MGGGHGARETELRGRRGSERGNPGRAGVDFERSGPTDCQAGSYGRARERSFGGATGSPVRATGPEKRWKPSSDGTRKRADGGRVADGRRSDATGSRSRNGHLGDRSGGRRRRPAKAGNERVVLRYRAGGTHRRGARKPPDRELFVFDPSPASGRRGREAWTTGHHSRGSGSPNPMGVSG